MPPGSEQAAEGSSYHAAPNLGAAFSNQPISSSADANVGPPYMPTSEGPTSQQHHSYATPTPFAYPDPSQPAMTSYNAATLPYDNQAYSEDMKPDLSAQLAAHNAGLAPPQVRHHQPMRPQQAMPSHDTHYMQSYSSPNPGMTTYAPTSSQGTPHQQHMATAVQPSNAVAWRQFTDNVMSNMSPHWSANALMALGQENANAGAPGPGAGMGTEGMGMEMDASVQAWPMMNYGPQHGAGQ